MSLYFSSTLAADAHPFLVWTVSLYLYPCTEKEQMKTNMREVIKKLYILKAARSTHLSPWMRRSNRSTDVCYSTAKRSGPKIRLRLL